MQLIIASREYKLLTKLCKFSTPVFYRSMFQPVNYTVDNTPHTHR